MSSPTPTESNNPSNIPSESKKFAGWAIAVIVITIILFFLTLAALIWAYKRYRNKKQLNGTTLNNMGHHGDDEKIPVLTPNKNESNVAIATGVTAAAVTKGTGKIVKIVTLYD